MIKEELFLDFNLDKRDDIPQTIAKHIDFYNEMRPVMLWDMIFLIIMNSGTGMESLRRKIPSEIVFYMKHLNSYKRKGPLLKMNPKK